MNLLKFEELTAPQLKKFCLDDKVILLSFGSIEQHSVHLPVGTDYLCMIKRVEEIAKRTESILFSPLQLGYSFNHIGMHGTISLDVKVFVDVVECMLRQLFRQGWKRILIFSGHNGNWSALKVAVQRVREDYPNTQVIFAEGYPRMNEAHRKNRFYSNFDFHAGLTETAMVSYYFEDKLDFEAIPAPNENIPILIKRLASKKDFDDIDVLLINALIPQHTQEISSNGMWGRNDPHTIKEVPVADAMKTYIDFYVKLIERWDEYKS